MTASHKQKTLAKDGLDLLSKSTLKADTSDMAKILREFYIRKELCKLCFQEGIECPYNHDTLTCVYGPAEEFN